MDGAPRRIFLEPPPRSTVRVRTVRVLLAAYALFVVLVAVWPSPVDGGVRPLINRVLRALHDRGVPDWIDYGVIEFSANMAFFVPLGFLVCLLLPWRFQAVAFAIAPAVSLLIEGTQALLLPARYASWLDVVANSAGGAIGIGAAMGLRALVRRRDRLVVANALWARGLPPDGP